MNQTSHFLSLVMFDKCYSISTSHVTMLLLCFDIQGNKTTPAPELPPLKGREPQTSPEGLAVPYPESPVGQIVSVAVPIAPIVEPVTEPKHDFTDLAEVDQPDGAGDRDFNFEDSDFDENEFDSDDDYEDEEGLDEEGRK